MKSSYMFCKPIAVARAYCSGCFALQRRGGLCLGGLIHVKLTRTTAHIKTTHYFVLFCFTFNETQNLSNFDIKEQ